MQLQLNAFECENGDVQIKVKDRVLMHITPDGSIHCHGDMVANSKPSSLPSFVASNLEEQKDKNDENIYIYKRINKFTNHRKELQRTTNNVRALIHARLWALSIIGNSYDHARLRVDCSCMTDCMMALYAQPPQSSKQVHFGRISDTWWSSIASDGKTVLFDNLADEKVPRREFELMFYVDNINASSQKIIMCLMTLPDGELAFEQGMYMYTSVPDRFTICYAPAHIPLDLKVAQERHYNFKCGDVQNRLYDCYGNPPSTFNEILEYLKTWLQPVTTSDMITTSHNEFKWTLTHAFKRAGHCHQAYKNDENGSYAFHVDNAADWDGRDQPPNFGTYDDYEAMLNGVAQRYARLWKVSSL